MNAKTKLWVRCIACNQYFKRKTSKGAKRLDCGDPSCEKKAKQIKRKERYMERKDRVIALIKDGCFFKGYNDCNGEIVLHCQDGTYFYEISGWLASSIYCMPKSDFEATLKKDLITLCKKHFNMVNKVQSEGGSFDEAILYVMDCHTLKAYNEREMK